MNRNEHDSENQITKLLNENKKVLESDQVW